MARFEVGQEAIVTDVNWRNRGEGVPTRIVKVGRKYVTAPNCWGVLTQFDMETGYQVGKYTHATLWTVEEYREKDLRKALAKRLAEFGVGPVGCGGFKLPTALLERLVAVLEEEG